MWMYIGAGVVFVLIVVYIFSYNRLRKLQVKVEEGSSGIDVALEKRFDLLSEELEAVKKYMEHEKETYTAVTAIRTGHELNEKKLEEQNQLSEEAIKTIDEQIAAQAEKMKQIRKQMEMNKKNGHRGNGKDREKQNMQKNAYDKSDAVRRMGVNQKVNMLSAIHHDLNGVGTTVDALAEQYPVLFSSIGMEHFQKTIFDVEEHLQAARRLYNSNVSLYNQTLSVIPFLFVAGLHGMRKADFYEIEEKKKNFTLKF